MEVPIQLDYFKKRKKHTQEGQALLFAISKVLRYYNILMCISLLLGYPYSQRTKVLEIL